LDVVIALASLCILIFLNVVRVSIPTLQTKHSHIVRIELHNGGIRPLKALLKIKFTLGMRIPVTLGRMRVSKLALGGRAS
jgi:hypothetical protein